MDAVTEVKPGGDTGGTGGVGVEQPKPWLEQVEKSLRGHDALREINDVNHLTQTFIKEREGRMKLEGDLKGMIKPLGEKPTPEEVSTFRKTMKIPEKPEEYEFPKAEGIEHDPKMVSWAQEVFHKFGLTKEAASGIGGEWNGFIKGMIEAEEQFAENSRIENEKTFHSKFKTEDEYKVGYELAKRHWETLTGTKFDEVYKDVDAWQTPLFMNYIFAAAKSIGEDTSPRSGEFRGSGTEVREGIQYKDMEKFKGG